MRVRFSPPSAKKCKHSFAQRSSLAAAGLVISLILMLTPVHAEIFDQYQVKAVFLYNLTNFIKWPNANAKDFERPFTIIVLGRDNLGTYLDRAISKETAHGRSIVIKRVKSLDDLRQQPCDLLFIGEDQQTIWPRIRAYTRQHAILTVSDVEGFAHRGGMVNLLTSGRRIRIEINIIEAKRSGFDISAKLLKLSRIVNGGKDK